MLAYQESLIVLIPCNPLTFNMMHTIANAVARYSSGCCCALLGGFDYSCVCAIDQSTLCCVDKPVRNAERDVMWLRFGRM